MKHENLSSYSGHDDVVNLLPWYVNGTLQGTELQQVKDHLGVCLTCRKELASLEALSRSLVHDPVVEISAKPSFERLMARMQSEQRQPGAGVPVVGTAKRSHGLWYRRCAAWLAEAMTPKQYAAALASGVLLLTIPFMLREMPVDTGTEFHTLATAGSMSQFASNDIRVVFADQFREGDMAALLESVQGRIVDGPSKMGVYTVRIGSESGPAMAVDQAIARLRQDTNVVLAERALSPAAD